MKHETLGNTDRNPWPMLMWLVLGPVPLILLLAFHSHAPARPDSMAVSQRQSGFLAAAEIAPETAKVETSAEKRLKDPQAGSRR